MKAKYVEGKVFKRDLADIGDANYNKRRGEFILCEVCGNEFGGTRGDYFNMPDNQEFECPACGNDAELYLVKKVEKYVRVKDEAEGGK